MKEYRKKPVVVLAKRWYKIGDVPESSIKPYENLFPDWVCNHCGKGVEEHGMCDTLEGFHIVCPGDYIIRGIAGEFYPCKPDIFSKTYESNFGAESVPEINSRYQRIEKLAYQWGSHEISMGRFAEAVYGIVNEERIRRFKLASDTL